MATAAPRSDRRVRSLQSWYHQQVLGRTEEEWSKLAGLVGVGFRPQGHTDCFESPWRVVGTTALLVASYGRAQRAGDFTGYVCRLGADGSASYALEGRVFRHDMQAGWLSGLHAERNPTLLESMLRVDVACQRAMHSQSLRSLPRLPRIWLGFIPTAPAQFEFTPALERITAARVELPLEQFRRQADAVRDVQLRQAWQSLLIASTDPENPTGLELVDAEFCTQATRALRAFEDFRDLLGVATYNPAREMEVLRAINPAAEILQHRGLRHADLSELDQSAVDGLEAELRELLGDWSDRFTQEDLYDALIEPNSPLVATSEVVDRVRRRLSAYWSDCSTDEDVRRAICNPDGPLLASQAVKVQVLRPRGTIDLDCQNWGRRVALGWEPRPWPDAGALQ